MPGEAKREIAKKVNVLRRARSVGGLTFGCRSCGEELPAGRGRMADHGLVRCTCPKCGTVTYAQLKLLDDAMQPIFVIPEPA
jgi:uncharacterized Zn finger protein